jgi:hypothetical protein
MHSLVIKSPGSDVVAELLAFVRDRTDTPFDSVIALLQALGTVLSLAVATAEGADRLPDESSQEFQIVNGSGVATIRLIFPGGRSTQFELEWSDLTLVQLCDTAVETPKSRSEVE